MWSQTPGGGGGAPYPLELRRTHGEWVYILGSYLTRVLYPARISKVAVVLCGDDSRIHALVPFATSSPLALKDTFVGARNLSNHAKASSTPLFANLKILDVFSIYSVQISFFMYLYHNGALPISLTQIFHTGNQIHQYSTKYSDVYRPQTCRTNIKKNSICFKVLEYGSHYRTTSKAPRLLIHPSVWSNHF